MLASQGAEVAVVEAGKETREAHGKCFDPLFCVHVHHGNKLVIGARVKGLFEMLWSSEAMWEDECSSTSSSSDSSSETSSCVSVSCCVGVGGGVWRCSHADNRKVGSEWGDPRVETPSCESMSSDATECGPCGVLGC